MASLLELASSSESFVLGVGHLDAGLVVGRAFRVFLCLLNQDDSLRDFVDVVILEVLAHYLLVSLLGIHQRRVVLADEIGSQDLCILLKEPEHDRALVEAFWRVGVLAWHAGRVVRLLFEVRVVYLLVVRSLGVAVVVMNFAA